MLKVKFWKIENVVLMKVLEQGNEICRGAGIFYKDKETGLTLASSLYVAISRDVLYVKGEKRQDDNNIVTRNLNTITESNDFYNRAIKKEWDASHSFPLYGICHRRFCADLATVSSWELTASVRSSLAFFVSPDCR